MKNEIAEQFGLTLKNGKDLPDAFPLLFFFFFFCRVHFKIGRVKKTGKLRIKKKKNIRTFAAKEKYF